MTPSKTLHERLIWDTAPLAPLQIQRATTAPLPVHVPYLRSGAWRPAQDGFRQPSAGARKAAVP
jgi:hypothetical protein